MSEGDGAIIGTAYVRIRANASTLAADIEGQSAPALTGLEKKAEASSGKFAAAFSKAGKSLGSFGIPMSGALDTIGTKLDATSTKGSSALQKLSGAALPLVAGLAAAGVAAVHFADEFDVAHGRLSTTVANVGESMSTEGSKIKETDDKLVNLGFTSTETETALSSLVGATHDVGTATTLMGLAANIARGRHIDLAAATDILVKVETGHVGLLGRLGINTKDATGKTIDQTTAVQRLTQLYGGQASAYLDTYAGKTAVLKAKSEEVAVSLGTVEKQALEHLGNATLDIITKFQSFNRTLDGVPGKALAVGAGLTAVAIIGAKVVTTVQSVAASFGIGTAATVADTAALEANAAAAAADASALNGLSGAAAAAATATSGEGVAGVGAAAAGAGVGLGAVAAAALPVAATAGAIAYAWQQGDQLDRVAKNLAIDLAAGGTKAAEAGDKFSHLFGGNASADITRYSLALRSNASDTDKNALKQKILADAYENAGLKANGYTKVTDMYSGSAASLKGQVDTVTRALGDQEKQTAKTSAATQDAGEKQAAAAAAAKVEAAAEQTLDTALQHLNDDTLTAANAQLSAQSAFLAVGGAADTYAQKLLALKGAKHGDTAASRDAQSAGIALNQSILDAIGKSEDYAKSQFDLTTKTTGVSKALGEENAKHGAGIDMISQLEKQYPALKGDIEAYAKSLGLIPPTIATNLQLNIAGQPASIAQVHNLVTDLHNPGAGLAFARGGIASGPSSGYPATLHGREVILPENDPARSLQVLAQSGLVGKMIAAAGQSSSSTATSGATVSGNTFVAVDPESLARTVARKVGERLALSGAG